MRHVSSAPLWNRCLLSCPGSVLPPAVGTWRRGPTPDLCSTRTPPTTAPEAGCHCGRTSLRVPLAPEARAVGGESHPLRPEGGRLGAERTLALSTELHVRRYLWRVYQENWPRDFPGGPVVRFSGPRADGPGSTPRQRTGSHTPQLRVHRPPEDGSAHVLQRHSQMHK